MEDEDFDIVSDFFDQRAEEEEPETEEISEPEVDSAERFEAARPEIQDILKKAGLSDQDVEFAIGSIKDSFVTYNGADPLDDNANACLTAEITDVLSYYFNDMDLNDVALITCKIIEAVNKTNDRSFLDDMSKITIISEEPDPSDEGVDTEESFWN